MPQETLSKIEKLYELAFIYLACLESNERNDRLIDYVDRHNRQVSGDSTERRWENGDLICVNDVMRIVQRFLRHLRAYKLDMVINFDIDTSLDTESGTPLYIYECEHCSTLSYDALYIKGDADPDDGDYDSQFISHDDTCVYCGVPGADELMRYYAERWVNQPKYSNKKTISRFDIMEI